MGVAVWPMVELEADDALASAARIAAADDGVEQVCIWTPDKDLAQCVRGDRVVQVDRRAHVRPERGRRAREVRRRARADPRLPRAGRRLGRRLSGHPRASARVTAARLLNRARRDRGLPARGARGAAASSRCCSRTWRRCGADAELFPAADDLRWRGPTSAWAACAEHARRRPPAPRGAARPTQREAPPCRVSGAVCDGLRSGERGHVGEDGVPGELAGGAAAERSLARGWARHRHLHPLRAVHVLP